LADLGWSRLQELLLQRLGPSALITPGVGVDPTNVFRDGDYASDAARRHYASQVTGKQDLARRNLLKVSLDYFIQGFCLSSLTLRGSAFYNSAASRTAAFRAFIGANATAPLCRCRAGDACGCQGGGRGSRGGGPRAKPPPCAAEVARGGSCQHQVCGLARCNLV